jgi:glycerol-3-phosphate dehydrogenase subunit C
MERIFDICHGCRRCVSLCNAFPKLFDFIDEAGDAETAGVPKEKFWQVVDQCYLCDVCYMTKCPYVPPHQWNLDFPHTMLRAKAIQYKTGKMKFRDKLLTSTELVGTLSSIPVVAQVVNAANKFGPARTVLQGARRRCAPRTARVRLGQLPRRGHGQPQPSGQGRQANTSRQGRRILHLLRQLQRAGHRPRPAQAARPQRDALRRGQGRNLLRHAQAGTGRPGHGGEVQGTQHPADARLAQAGYAIVTPVPSCTLMFKSEIPLLFPDDARCKDVSAAMYDPFEYFVLRNKDGLLKTDFKVNRWARFPTTSPATHGCRTWAGRPRKCSS